MDGQEHIPLLDAEPLHGASFLADDSLLMSAAVKGWLSKPEGLPAWEALVNREAMAPLAAGRR